MCGIHCVVLLYGAQFTWGGDARRVWTVLCVACVECALWRVWCGGGAVASDVWFAMLPRDSVA